MPSAPTTLNVTQKSEVMQLLFEEATYVTAPLLLTESFFMGLLCAAVPLGSYLVWIKLRSINRASIILVAWLALIVVIVRWSFDVRQFEATIRASIFGSASENGVWFFDPFVEYREAWQSMLPLITETVLFGFGTVLFTVTAYLTFWRLRSQRSNRFSLIVSIMASLMYTTSLAHWVTYLQQLVHELTLAQIPALAEDARTNASDLALLAFLSINTIMSDAIVLWRMCLVWDNKRVVLVSSGLLLVTTLALNIANIAGTATTLHAVGAGYTQQINQTDSEIFGTYGLSTVGLATAFVSLASNFYATVLVGLKAWLSRRRIAEHVRSNDRRTITERIMELLVDSGTIYTTIWALYCVSFFRPVTEFHDYLLSFTITAVDHLDAAMAQITSIYPLLIFIFMELDKARRDHGPRALRASEWSGIDKEEAAESDTFDIDVEHSAILAPSSLLEPPRYT